MSFILDALRKSEHERQRQTGPDFAPLHAARVKPAVPIWAIAVAALLGVNIIVVLVLVLRGGQQTAAVPDTISATATAPAAESVPAVNPPPAPASPAPAIVERRPFPQPQMPEPATANVQPQPTRAQTPQPAPEPAAMRQQSPEPTLDPGTNERLPSIDELNFSGANALPPLHLDIHVYATKPAERFVFINMNKYKEGARTAEGIVVERITPDGVILDRDGTRFTLPRQ